MRDDARLLLLAPGAVIALIVLVARFRLHPFIALVGVSLATGVALGMAPAAAVRAFQDGVRSALGFIIVGIPVFFQVGFVLLVPLVFTIARRTGMSLIKIGIRWWPG